jgi:DNA-binding MarR family transcriptional regulator
LNEREESVVRALLNHPDEWITRREIARRIGLKKTPYLIEVVDRLVERGVIERQLGSWGGFSCWFFRTTPERVQPFLMFPVSEWIAEWSIRHGSK